MAVAMGCVDNSPNPCSAVDDGGRNCFSDLLSDEWMCVCLSWNSLEWCFNSLCDAGELLVMVMTTGPFAAVVVVRSKGLHINLSLRLVPVVA